MRPKNSRKPILVIGPSIAYIDLLHGYFSLVDRDSVGTLDVCLWWIFMPKRSNTMYACRSGLRIDGVKQGSTPMHRFLMGCPPEEIDHVNGNGLDNRLSNLRKATKTEQSRNTDARKYSISGIKGVSLHAKTGLWRARIVVNKKEISLGYFRDVVLAAKAYDDAAIKHFGDFYRKPK